MTTITKKTYWVKIYLAGDIEQAKQVCREFTHAVKKDEPVGCVTIEPCEYIYAGGQESGYVVGCINYPRFPSTPKAVFARAKLLAEKLIERTCQHSALIMAPDKTVWMTTRRKDN